MNNVVIKLANNCKNIYNSKKSFKIDIYNEIIDLILNGNYEENKVIDLLIELYRYAYYCEVRTSLDLRGDAYFKTSALVNIKKSLLRKELTSELIENFKKTNNLMREFIDSPVKLIEEEIKLNSKPPYVMF